MCLLSESILGFSDEGWIPMYNWLWSIKLMKVEVFKLLWCSIQSLSTAQENIAFQHILSRFCKVYNFINFVNGLFSTDAESITFRWILKILSIYLLLNPRKSFTGRLLSIVNFITLFLRSNSVMKWNPTSLFQNGSIGTLSWRLISLYM